MRMLLLLFIVVPILEMVLLIKVGSLIGALPTVALVCLTAMIGVALIRAQGFSTFQRAQWRVDHGELPAQEIIDGMCLAVGGAMLLTPGFVTDGFGFLLLVPGLRKSLFKKIAGRVSFGAFTQTPREGQHTDRQGHAPGANTKPNTLEGEFWRDE